MRIVLQRVTEASVSIVDSEGEVAEHARIGPGAVALVGFENNEREETSEWMAAKVAGLRVFPGPGGPMDRSLRDTGGELLVVSQFTLYGETGKGRRPDFGRAAPFDAAESMYERFCACCRGELPDRVRSGVFGAHMRIALINDGPVTLLLER